MDKFPLKPTTMAVRTDPDLPGSEDIIIALVQESARIAIEGEIEFLPAFVPNVLGEKNLSMMLFGVMQAAKSALTQHKKATHAISIGSWDPPAGGLKTRYAFAAIVDRFGNTYAGSYPDPNTFLAKGWKVGFGRFVPGATQNSQTPRQGPPQALIGDDLKDCPGDYREQPIVVAVMLALRVLANPGEITEQLWPEI